jgi:small-conductance mechanosensitive channel
MSPLEVAAQSLAAEALGRDGLLQYGAIAACLAAGWLIARVARARLAQGVSRWKFGEGGFQRVVFPLSALALLWAVRHAMSRSMAVPLLDVAVTLLLALAIIRFSVYVLRHILAEGAFLRGSERTLAWAIWGGVVLYVTGLLPGMLEALDAIELTLGKQRISLLLVITALVSVAVTLAISMWIARLIEGRVLANEAIEISTRAVIAKLVRAIAFFAAILVALPIVGIDITALSVFGGALGVGLGFGLQKIASNYVSGYIILLDRSIRIGDLVTVENRQGVVTEIASRYTVVRSLDGAEAIIPNESMITQTVVNHSYSDRRVAVKVPVTIAYTADLGAATEVLVAAARAQPRVLAEPAPDVSVQRLGESGVELELSAWIADPERGQGAIRSAILKEVLAGFGSRGIEVPAARREIHWRATDETREKPLPS